MSIEQDSALNAQTIDQIAQAVAARIAAHIPEDVELWDVATIATFLKCKPATVRDQITCQVGFPKAIRVKTTGGTGHPRYNAKEVIRWVYSHRDKN